MLLFYIVLWAFYAIIIFIYIIIYCYYYHHHLHHRRHLFCLLDIFLWVSVKSFSILLFILFFFITHACDSLRRRFQKTELYNNIILFSATSYITCRRVFVRDKWISFEKRNKWTTNSRSISVGLVHKYKVHSSRFGARFDTIHIIILCTRDERHDSGKNNIYRDRQRVCVCVYEKEREREKEMSQQITQFAWNWNINYSAQTCVLVFSRSLSIIYTHTEIA